MKTKILTIGILLVVSTALCAATNDLSMALQKGLFEEEANRNLDAAIQAYQSVAARFDKVRQLAATAIFRLGECYRKLGKTNEATVQYERIVQEFSDQQTLVTLSRQNLTGLGSSGGNLSELDQKKAPASTTVGNQAYDRALLRQIKKLSPAKARQLMPTLVPDQLLVELLSQHQVTEAKLAEQTTTYGPDHPEIKKTESVLKTLDQQIQTRIDGIINSLELRVSAADRAGPFASSGNNVEESVPAATNDEEKEIRRIREMIKNSPDLINASVEGVNGNLTPLCRAANEGQLLVAKFLLDNGAAIDGRSRVNSTALYEAAKGGHKAMVELLAEHGADINARNRNGETALHLAATKGFTSVAEALIQRKADVNARDDFGVTPLNQAEMHGHIDMLHKLLSAGAKTDIQDKNGWTPLHFAAAYRQLDAVKALLAAKADPNTTGKAGTPLFSSLQNPECMKLLLEAGANPNIKKDGEKTLHLTSGESRGRMMERSSQGVDGQTPLLAAIEAMGNRQTPLVAAAADLYYESAVLLIQHGADVNAANDKGMTPIQMAVWAESIPMISLLLKNHADVNAPGPGKRNALIMAKEAINGFLPYEPGNYDRSDLAVPNLAVPNKETARKIAEMLLQHGAVEVSDKP